MKYADLLLSNSSLHFQNVEMTVPRPSGQPRKFTFHKKCVQKKCAYLSQTPINIHLDKQVRTEQIKRRDGLMEQLGCLQFLARQGLAR